MKKCPNCHEELNWDKIKKFFQTYEGHILDALKILHKYIEINEDVIDQFCERWQLNNESFLKSLFVTVFLHDIAKLTDEFQKNIARGKSSSRYPHAYYALSILNSIELPNLLNVPLEKAAILGHHRQLYGGIYDNYTVFGVPTFLKGEIDCFVKTAKKVHAELLFGTWFQFDGLKMQSIELTRPNKVELRRLRNNIISETSNFEDKEKIKSVFSYLLSILKICDDYSSADFSEFISQYKGTNIEFDSTIEEPEKYVLRPCTEMVYERILKNNKPYHYQADQLGGLCGDVPFFGLLFAPCGRGKTETALIWALKALKKYKRNKIIFAMPTQITSNAMWERFCEIFGNGESQQERIETGKKQVGLFHGKSFIVLKASEKGEENEEELDFEIQEEVKGENFKGNVFFKPINVTTIDHVVNSFIHGFPQADFAIGNLQNAVIVFDEVHYYEQQTLEHLMTLLELLKKMQIPTLLMSGTLPEFFIQKVKEVNNEFQNLYSDEEGLLFEPFKIMPTSKPILLHNETNEKVIDEIIENYHNKMVQFVILNTVERSKLLYDTLKSRLPDEGKNIILHNSQFTYKDRAEKEKNLLKELQEKKTRPFILVATQVIEISLDISCDVMYTELAPADAIGQRGGRLNRKGRTWKSNGFEYTMKIFMPEELFEEDPQDRPYSVKLLKKTHEVIKNRSYSYHELKQLCDMVYSDYELQTRPDLKILLHKCSLFGYSPYEINFGDEDKSRLFEFRQEKEQKLDVIPWQYYKGDEGNLTVENQAQVPLWWYKQDDRHIDGSERFIMRLKNGKKPYWITTIQYSQDKGFDLKAPLVTPPADNVI